MKNQEIIKTKLIRNNLDNDSNRNLFLSEAFLKEKNPFNNTNNINNKHNIKIKNNLYNYNNIGFSITLLPLPKLNNKNDKNLSFATLRKSINNLNYNNLTSSNEFNNKKKKDNYTNKRNETELKFNDLYFKTTSNNDNDDYIEEKIQKLSLRNLICDNNYRNKEIKKTINIKKEEETDFNSENQTNKKPKFFPLDKFRRKEIIKRDERSIIISNKNETFNKNEDSNNNNNFLKSRKNFKSLNQVGKITIKKYNSYKGYYIQQYIPKRKMNNNDDIIELLNTNS